jgi:hypothetical protein
VGYVARAEDEWTGRGREDLVADTNDQGSLEDEERLVLPVVDVGWGLSALASTPSMRPNKPPVCSALASRVTSSPTDT